jgi:hypothetical protein
MPRSLSRLAIALMALSAALAATAGAASAEPVAIPGNPMTVYVGPQGQLQAFLSGRVEGIYYHPGEQLGDAGFFLAIPEEEVWGFEGTAGPEGLAPYEEVEQGPVTGSGSAADPLTQVTEYAIPGDLYVTETTTYVNGATEFTNRWEVTNESGATARFRAFAAADFYFEGDDRGTGVFTLGPPRFIGGTNVDTGRSGGFVEVTGGAGLSPPWSHYQELPYPNIWDEVIQNAADPAVHFNDTVDPEDEDNAGGVEWDQYETNGLLDNHTATFEVITRVAVPAALMLDPTNAGAPQGVPIGITATALDSIGAPYAGQALRYTITGVNPGTGALTLDGSGKAVITDPGTNAGGDTISAFVDFNNDGVREDNEPQASAVASFVDSIPPSCTVKVKGDRPGGIGGAGNRLVISVNCDETTSLTVRTTLIAPAPRPKKGRHKKAHRSVATAAKKRGKHHRKKRKIKLPKSTATIEPGVDAAVNVKVPKGIARRYAGRKLTARIVAAVTDGTGNTTTTKTTRKVRIAKPKQKKHRKNRHSGRGQR